MHPVARGCLALALLVPAGVLLAQAGLGQDLAPCEQAPGTSPELVVVDDSVGVTAQDVEPGDPTNFTATVKNEGDAPVDGFNYNFSLNNQTYQANLTHSGCLQDGGDTTTIQTNDTWTAEAGVHNISATAYGAGADTGSDVVRIGPDLSVRSFKVSDTNPVEGDQVTFTAKIANTAEDSDVDQTFEVDFASTDTTLVSPVTVEGLDAGSTTTVSRTWTASGDQLSIIAEVDRDDNVPDRDPDDDIGGPVNVDVRPARPDLVVGSLDLSPDPPRPDEELTLDVTFRNNGRAQAGSQTAALFVDGASQAVDTTTVSSVAAGGEINASLSWRAEEGVHDLELVVDANDNVTEKNEDNNAAVRQVSVGADLTVSDLSVQPSDPRSGDRIRFTVTVANDGLSVPDAFDVAFNVDGEPVGTTEIPGLDADRTRNATSKTWTAETGDHNVTVTVDPDGQIAEVDKGNNQLSRQLTVGEPQPDLTVVSAVLDPAAPGEGDTAEVQAQVVNEGGRAAGAFAVTSAIDGEAIGEAEVQQLDPGARRTLSLGNWTAETGAHELVVEADPGGQVEESREANNTFTESFVVGKDLTASDLTVTPSEPEPGEEATATLLVRNNGSVQTPSVPVRFTLDGRPLGTANLSELGPNEEQAVELTFTATRSGQLTATVDPDGSVSEVAEGNNELSVDLQLPGSAEPADLTIRSLGFQGDPGSDDRVNVTAVVANVGAGPAGSSTIAFRVDGSTVGGPTSVPALASGEEATVVGPSWEPSGDSQEVSATIDPENTIPESDEENNTLARSTDGGPSGVPLPAWVPLIGGLVAAVAARGARGTESESL